MNIPGDANVKLSSTQGGWTVEEQVKKHQGGCMMDFEKQIEDLCLEKLRLEREDTTQEPADNIEGQAKAQARYQIRLAKIQAIDSQLEELRNKVAKNYKEDITIK